MRFVLKILSILIIGGTTVFNVVACNKCSTDGSKSPDNKPIIYNILFKEVATVSGINFKVSNLYNRYFSIKSDSVIDSSELPSNFYNEKGWASFYVDSQQIWDQVGKVYGFDMNTDSLKISDIMLINSINNVSMRIRLGSYPYPTAKGVWIIENFSATLAY